MEKVLEVRGLTKLYKNKRGIRDISFDVQKGDIFGFLGPNGAGKTTTMKIITGLCRADKGEVRVFGHDIGSDFEKAMSKIGCIIENPEAYNYLSAYKNLEQASRYHKGIGKDRINEVMELVGLSRYMHERVSGYSLGMKQRLGLASAILAKPELVILDEPANGLDIEGMVDIRNIILRLAKDQNITFFISSHLIHEMELTCSRVAIVSEGSLAAVDEVNSMLSKYGTLENCFLELVHSGRRSVVNE